MKMSNKKIKVNDFLDKIKKSKVDVTRVNPIKGKQIITSLAVLSALAMGGCATTNNMEHQNKQIKEINNTTAIEMLESNRSGVYKNPFDNSVVTVSFIGDIKGDERILKDIDYLGMSNASYTYNKAVNVLVDTFGGKVAGRGSRNIQDPVGLFDDINYIKMDTNEHVINPAVLEDNKDLEKYSSYFILMHEIAHSFAKQQMSLLDIVYAEFNKDQLLVMENSSDITGAIKTIGMMNANGESDAQIEFFLDAYIEGRFNPRELGQKKAEEGMKSHDTGFALSFIKDIFIENKDFLLNMTNSEIEDFSILMASKIVDIDVKKDVLDSMMAKDYKELVEVINTKKDHMKNDPEKHDKLVKNMEMMVEENKYPEKTGYIKKILDAGKDILSFNGKDVARQLVEDKIKNGVDKNNKITIGTEKGQKIIIDSKLKSSKTVMKELKKVAKENGYDISSKVENKNNEVKSVRKWKNK
jgi:hypothetical protein